MTTWSSFSGVRFSTFQPFRAIHDLKQSCGVKDVGDGKILNLAKFWPAFKFENFFNNNIVWSKH